MKKLILIILLLFILFLTALYIYIPDPITTQISVVIKAPERALVYYLSPQKGWHTWWPGTKDHGLNISNSLDLDYKKAFFSFNQPNYYTITSVTKIKNFNSKGNITFFIVNNDSIRVSWNSAAHTDLNPVDRLTHFFAAKKHLQYKSEILDKLKTFLEDEKNIYGISIQKTKVTDTLVLTTKITTSVLPSNQTIYHLIGNLRKYIQSSDAKETNLPIYNITVTKPQEYQTMVAIPVNKYLSKKDDIECKRMVKAELLTTEVTGGRSKVENAIQQIDLYMKDHGLDSPAIPFSRLITDRLIEKDSTKWITRVYYPVY